MRNSYQLCNNGTLRVMYANGMSISFHSEPHVLAGTVTPTIGRCNISLPMENGLNSIEWRLRKEQIKGKVTVFGRKLRVSRTCYNNHLFLFGENFFFFFWRTLLLAVKNVKLWDCLWCDTVWELSWLHRIIAAISYRALFLKVSQKRLVKMPRILQNHRIISVGRGFQDHLVPSLPQPHHNCSKPYPQMPYSNSSWTHPEMVTPPTTFLPGQLTPIHEHSFTEKSFSDI